MSTTYVTVMQPAMYRQMSLEEFLFSGESVSAVINSNETNTRTVRYDIIPGRIARLANVEKLIAVLEEFNRQTSDLRAADKKTLYKTFYIPKKKGGMRRIDAPCDELMEALRRLKAIFEMDFKALYHTSAFAYISHRCTLDAVKRHQTNESKWFGKFDLHDFFGSTTMEFVLKQFSMIFPFSEVMKTQRGAKALGDAMSLAFLNGGLPQGTPISPIITNVMMIPIDFELSNGLRDFENNHFVYTRYADDFIISSRRHFNCKAVGKFIVDTLKKYNAPFTLNEAKTRYGSSTGTSANWNLGVILTGDNRITIGMQKKRQFRAMLVSFVTSAKCGVPWPLEDVMVLEGYRNYYRMVEGDYIDDMVSRIGQKYNVNIPQMIKEQIRG